MSITATPEQLSALVDAAWQVLDDMRDGNCCCGLARSQLRIAFEPFRLQDDDLDLEFPLEPCLQMMSQYVEIREGNIKKGGLNPQPIGERPPPPKSHAPPGIKERVAKIQTLRREYDNAMLNEDLDSYDDLLDAVKDVLIELGYPPLIHDDTKAGT